MTVVAVPAELDRDNTDRFGQVTGVDGGNAQRALHLLIDRPNGRFRLRVQGAAPDLFDVEGGAWEAEIPLTAEELWGAVATLRTAWRKVVVDRRAAGGHPFQDGWDFSGTAHEGLLAEVLPPLARAGAELFEKIFFPSCAVTDPEGYGRLVALGNRLREASDAGRNLWIRVTSDHFYAPWNLLYSGTLDRIDWKDARPEGFWGYQNLIEHVPMPPRAGAPPNRGYELDASRRLNVALHLDETIDESLGVACLAPVRDQLAGYAGTGSVVLAERNRSRELAEALARGSLDEHVLYFCCHAQTEGNQQVQLTEPYLALTDRGAQIRPGTLDFWLGPKAFLNGPLVFLNACQSGQMTSVFYKGFAPVFLNRRASGFVGTQTEVPACFAGEFARRFFSDFLRGGRSVGTVLWELRREFLDRHHNPLGLLYSVYRGADVILPGNR